MKKFYFSGLAIATLFSAQSFAQSYQAEHPDDNFFTEGQQWVLSHSDGNATSIVNVKIDGDVVINGKFEVRPGVIDEDDMTCKRIVITPEGGESKETGAFEMNNKIFVYSEKTGQFEVLADFSAPQGENVTLAGTEWNVDKLDYIYPEGTLRMRVDLKSGNNSITEVYGVGLSSFTASEQTWNAPGVYTFVSTTIPGEAELTESVFAESTFAPTNTFFAVGKEWINNQYNVTAPEDGQLTHYRVSGDASYANMNCRQIDSMKSDGSWEYKTLGCDYDGKVYVYIGGRMKLAMDFNLKVGDIAFPGIENSEVTKVDKVLVNGQECTRIKFAGADNEDLIWRYWVENVGASNGAYLYTAEYPVSVRNKMDECLLDGETIFTYEDFGKTSDVGVESIIDNETSTDSRIFDIMGREVNEMQPGSVYISNGRKFIGK